MNYPLMQNAAEQIQAASGRPLKDINLESLARGDLTAQDLQIHGDTLRIQAQIAREAGQSQLADNLIRAAELTKVPNEEILKMYELLRPARASFEKLIELAAYLETTYAAAETGRLIREAAEVYRVRGLVKR